jgi:hypothetical protein
MGRKGRVRLLGVAVLAGTVLLPWPGSAGGLPRVAARGAAKGLSAGTRGRTAQVLRRDLVRDRATVARPLPTGRTVFRYTTPARARAERRTGLRPGTHMTAHAQQGHPLSPGRAQQRYGLPTRPEVRETIRLPQGHPVRPNRAMGGAPGVGELTSPKRVPGRTIAKVVPLRPGRP